MQSHGGLTDSSNDSGLGLSLFFPCMSKINFLMSSGIIANIGEFFVSV